MDGKRLTIELFHQMLNSDREEEGTSMLNVLRGLTKITDTKKLAGGKPSPLGSWAGWPG